MKNNNPLQVLVLGSFIQLFIVFIVLLFLNHYVFPLPVFYLAGIPLIVGIAYFIVSFSLLKGYIHDRIQIIHRIIQHGGRVEIDHAQTDLRKDDIGKTANETANWAKERNEEINYLKEQAAFRREFLGNLAHELKTPVFSVQGYILTLLEGGLEDETVNRKFLERASFATERMTAILEDLDQIMKLEVNQVTMKMERFDLVQLVKEIIASFEEKVSTKSIHIKIEENYDPIFVKGDRPKIGQVFTNLIANSINYGRQEGITLIRFYEMGNSIMTEVSDDGLGIEEKDLPRLFERFYRVEQSRSRNEGGSGLGLAICKHIIESHDEQIAVKSTPKVGSTFSFSLQRKN
jgi:two-component system phosphate regulon sensor histidine kinase PhoR